MRETAKLWTAIGATVVSLGVSTGGDAQPLPDVPAAFSDEYPPIEDPAFQEGLLSFLTAARAPSRHFPPKAFSNVTDVVQGFGFAPYCYMTSEARRYSERLGRMEFSTDAYLGVLNQFLAECRAQTFVGKRGGQTGWIVVYDIPNLVNARAPANLVSYEKDNQHLLIIPMHPMAREEFPEAAQERALSEFNRLWED